MGPNSTNHLLQLNQLLLLLVLASLLFGSALGWPGNFFASWGGRPAFSGGHSQPGQLG